jgi:hypothetical protein
MNSRIQRDRAQVAMLDAPEGVDLEVVLDGAHQSELARRRSLEQYGVRFGTFIAAAARMFPEKGAVSAFREPRTGAFEVGGTEGFGESAIRDRLDQGAIDLAVLHAIRAQSNARSVRRKRARKRGSTRHRPHP